MKILITGSTGFIGTHLVENLRKNHEIYALAREVKKSEGITWIKSDLSKPIDFKGFPEKVDVILHFCQSNNYRNFPEKADDIYSVNTKSTFELLEYARKAGVKNFIYASSGGVTGYKKGKITEKEPLNPFTFYLTTKASSELLINSYSDFFNTVIFRIFFVYGEGQSDALIPSFFKNIKNYKPITIYDGLDGTHINPTYISDAVSAISNSINLKGHHMINIGGPETVSMRNLAVKIGNILKVKPTFNSLHNPLADMVCDIEKMRHLLNYNPVIKIDEGLNKVYEFLHDKL